MTPENNFLELAKEIPDLTLGKMFGTLCLKTPNGKAAAMFWKDHIVVKLHGEEYKDALSLDGSLLFEPMEGRPMKEWVQIPYEYVDKWKYYTAISADAVRKIPKKTSK